MATAKSPTGTARRRARYVRPSRWEFYAQSYVLYFKGRVWPRPLVCLFGWLIAAYFLLRHVRRFARKEDVNFHGWRLRLARGGILVASLPLIHPAFQQLLISSVSLILSLPFGHAGIAFVTSAFIGRSMMIEGILPRTGALVVGTAVSALIAYGLMWLAFHLVRALFPLGGVRRVTLR